MCLCEIGRSRSRLRNGRISGSRQISNFGGKPAEAGNVDASESKHWPTANGLLRYYGAGA